MELEREKGKGDEELGNGGIGRGEREGAGGDDGRRLSRPGATGRCGMGTRGGGGMGAAATLARSLQGRER